jgi:hypothetical protein
MALTFRSDGVNVTYQNLGNATYFGAADIPSGSIVKDNELVGVAMSEIVYWGNESGSLSGQRVADADQDFKFSENNICRIGEWAYDALISADVNAYTTVYWNSDFNVLVKDASCAEFISSITAGAPGWTNEGTYGAVTVVANSAVATTEWFQLMKNEHDDYYTLWGSFTGSVSAAITETQLTNGYQPAGLGLTITFASVTTAVGGDRWEWYCIKDSDTDVNLDIGIMVLPYVESKIKHLGQETFNIPLIKTKVNSATVGAGAYISAKWQDRVRDYTPSQGGGRTQTGKLLFQFVN